MIDKEQLRYDLALMSAAVMTLRELDKGVMGSPSGLMPAYFQSAYQQYGEEALSKQLDAIVEQLAKSE